MGGKGGGSATPVTLPTCHSPRAESARAGDLQAHRSGPCLYPLRDQDKRFTSLSLSFPIWGVIPPPYQVVVRLYRVTCVQVTRVRVTYTQPRAQQVLS